MFFAAQPQDTVNKFIKAMNNYDIKKVVTCLDPKQEKLFHVTSNIIGGIVGINPKDVFDIFPCLMVFNAIYMDDPQMQGPIFDNVKILSQVKSGKKAKVTVIATTNYYDGEQTEAEKLVFLLKKFNEGWRIVDIQSI
jgi:hypothetical protein